MVRTGTPVRSVIVFTSRKRDSLINMRTSRKSSDKATPLGIVESQDALVR